MILFILLNPSTADEYHDDPTNKRCITFAKKWGFGSLVFCNLFAFRTPYPKELFKASEPVGKENDDWIKTEANKAETIVVAWGNHGIYLNRTEEVKKLITGKILNCFGITNTGQPKHPLYLSGDTKLQIY